MKQIIYFLSLIILTFNILSCDPQGYASLSNVTFSMEPKKDSYSVGEEAKIVVSFIPNLSFYDKYTFSISLEEYNEYKNISLFENTKKLIFLESPDDNPITFQYEEKDLENDQMVTRTFSIKALTTGEFACSLSSHGHDRGYQSETGSDARISFLVEN